MHNTTPASSSNQRWDLSLFYRDLNDPQIDADLTTILALAKTFFETHKGKLSIQLDSALTDYITLTELVDKLTGYLFLIESQDQRNAAIKSRKKTIDIALAKASAEHLNFFDHEINSLEETTLAELAANNDVVARHMPFLRRIRMFKPHKLPEQIEQALDKRSPFGPGTWPEFFDKIEASLQFPFENKNLTLAEILNVLNNDADANKRAAALEALNKGLGGTFGEVAAQTLNVLIGASNLEDEERKYTHPMQARNMSNMLADDVVEALHTAVLETGAPLAQRFYKIKAKLLGINESQKLRWSDRNAPLPFEDRSQTPYDTALDTVIDAYQAFSPTLAGLVKNIVDNKWIDAPSYEGKSSGAFNMSLTLPNHKGISYVLLNYLGSSRDIMTLAHELGHGVHGLLSGESQGVLMQHAPIAYAETASVFGERMTFERLLEKCRATGDKKALLALLTGKIDDILNTVVRQISFSDFERRTHAAGRTLSPAEYGTIWRDVTTAYYGKEGEVFTYENIDNLWAYISHFHRSFYVYGYACGELVTQSLYAARPELGEKFEPLYIELLRAGNTKPLHELLAPFGLDPTKPTFWKTALESGLEKMITEAEEICAILQS